MKHPALLSLFCVALVTPATSSLSAPGPIEFERAMLLLEVNATDGDAEIVLDLKTDEEIVRLELVGPVVRAQGESASDGGLKVIEIRATRQTGLGLSQILLETGEPSVSAVLVAYPVGTYMLRGETLAGLRFQNPVELTHDLLAAPELVFPLDGDEGVPVAGLTIQWVPNPAAAGWVVEVEHDDLGVKVLAELPAGTSGFSVPSGFLASGFEYDFGVRAIHPDGNVIVTEASFTTG